MRLAVHCARTIVQSNPTLIDHSLCSVASGGSQGCQGLCSTRQSPIWTGSICQVTVTIPLLRGPVGAGADRGHTGKRLAGTNCLWKDVSFERRLFVGTLAPMTALALHSVPALCFTIKGTCLLLTDKLAARTDGDVLLLSMVAAFQGRCPR